MRPHRLFAAAICVVVAAACGQGDEPTPEPSTTTSIAATATTEGPTTTAASATTTAATVVEATWSVEALGRSPDGALGDDGALGSGCSPGKDTLPDGAWFGWVTAFDPSSVEFDLACLWPGRLDAAASNDTTRLRTVPVAGDALLYGDEPAPLSFADWAKGGEPAAASNASGLPDGMPYWLFVNAGRITEIAGYPHPIRWARAAASAWPGSFIGPVAGDIGLPASPDAPWPGAGWPADGFYDAEPDTGTADAYELSIRKLLSCSDDANPGFCFTGEGFTGDEVYVDPKGSPLQRMLRFDDDLTVVIKGVRDATPIVGDGVAYAALLADLTDSMDESAVASSTLEIPEDRADWEARIANPDFPFGVVIPGGIPILAYRGPGGALLTLPGVPWFYTLEIRDGRPVLYVVAGRIAG